jgi:hypothetical protein
VAVPTPSALAWERATGERRVLALPDDAGSIVAPASMPYAVEVCSVAGLPPSATGAEQVRERVDRSGARERAVLCIASSWSRYR